MQDPPLDEYSQLATVTHRRAGAHVFARVVGEIDMSNAHELRALLIGLVDAATTSLSVDLSRVGFIDSSGLGQLVILRRELDEADVPMDVLVAPGSVVDRTLTQFGAQELLPSMSPAGQEMIPTQPPSP